MIAINVEYWCTVTKRTVKPRYLRHTVLVSHVNSCEVRKIFFNVDVIINGFLQQSINDQSNEDNGKLISMFAFQFRHVAKGKS